MVMWKICYNNEQKYFEDIKFFDIGAEVKLYIEHLAGHLKCCLQIFNFTIFKLI